MASGEKLAFTLQMANTGDVTVLKHFLRLEQSFFLHGGN